MTPKRPVGRPYREFDQELADRICNGLADGMSLRQVVKAKGMPSRPTVRRWLLENQQFAAQYARARLDGADSHADDVTDLANATTPTNAHAQKVKIQARQWTAGAQSPKYKDQPAAVQVNVSTPITDPETFILETARTLCFLLDSGERVLREREEDIALLPQPAKLQETE